MNIKKIDLNSYLNKKCNRKDIKKLSTSLELNDYIKETFNFSEANFEFETDTECEDITMILFTPKHTVVTRLMNDDLCLKENIELLHKQSLKTK